VRYDSYRKGDQVEHDEALSRAVELMAEAGGHRGSPRATSVRLPEALHELAMLAGEMGWEESFTATVTESLADRLSRTIRREAIAAQVARFPDEVPALAAVAARRVEGTAHPAAGAPSLIRTVADHYEQSHPTWAADGDADRAVDEVLDRVELLVDLQVADVVEVG